MTDLADDRGYRTANIPVFLLRCLSAAVAERGGDAARLCAGLGITPEDLADPACRVSFRQGGEMIRRALKQAKGHGLGLEIGERETIASIGLVGFAMVTCRTLGEAIALGIEQQKHTGSMLLFEYHADEKSAVIRANSRFHAPDIQTFLVEEAFASMLKVARGLVGETFVPRRVDFAYPAPDYAAEYQRVFGCEVRFGQAANLFVSDAAWAGKKLLTHDPLSHRQIMEFLDQARQRERESQELVESVERLLRQKLDELPGLAAIARALCQSERTLRRRLAQCGVSYQSLLDAVRKNRALELLGNPRLSVEQVAFAVGFSDPHNFRRAFRRWTGAAPSEMRHAGHNLWPELTPMETASALAVRNRAELSSDHASD